MRQQAQAWRRTYQEPEIEDQPRNSKTEAAKVEDAKKEMYKQALKHPLAILAMIGVGTFIALHASSYLLDAASKAAISLRRFKHSIGT